MDLYIDTENRLAVTSGYDSETIDALTLRVGDTIPFNFYFLDVNPYDDRAPFSLRRYASAAITATLFVEGSAAVATQSSWTEIVPTTTAPSITRTTSGTASVGEYDRITLASRIASGSIALVLTAGNITSKGATSASARIYPGVSTADEIASAFANSIGAPWAAEFISPTIIDLHGTAGPTTPARITEVNVTNAQYLYGWTASLALTAGGVAALANLDDVYLAIALTPSGGAARNVLKLPINLVA